MQTRLLVLLTVALCLWLTLAQSSQQACKPEDYGAVADGVSYDTAAIQKALDVCSKTGGTVVFREGGQYLTGTVVMTGTVHALLPAGAALLGGDRREDYLPNFWDWYVVYMRNCTGCSFTGAGRVDGQAKLWVTGMRNPWEKEIRQFQDPTCWNPIECRPRLFGVRDSQQVLLEGIKLVDPIYWNLHIMQSDQVTVRGLTIWGDPLVPNNDGMDIDSSTNVHVSHTDVSALDDAICVKTDDARRPLENVTIVDCTARSWGTGLKLGTESRGLMRNVTFRRTTVLPRTHRGISLQLRDQGSMEDVLFEDIVVHAQHYEADWWGAGEAITLTAQRRNQTQSQLGHIRGVTFRNITAFTENGIVIVGSPGNAIQDVSIVDMRLSLVKVTSLPGGYRDVRPGVATCIKGVPDDAVYLEDVNNMRIQGLQVQYSSPARPRWGGLVVTKPGTVTGLLLQDVGMTDSCTAPPAAGLVSCAAIAVFHRCACAVVLMSRAGPIF